MSRPMCHICHESNYRLLYNEEVYKAKAPKSKKSILDVIKHISRVIKVTFNVPARARVCISCYKELVRYDCYVVELLQVQKVITAKIYNRAKNSKTSLTSSSRAEYYENQQSNEFLENEHTVKEDECSDFETEEPKEDNAFDSDNIIEESEFVEDEFEDPEEGDLVSSGTFACPVCNMKFMTQKDVDSHLDSEHKTRVTCSECGVQVRNEEYLVLHMNIHNGKTETECSFCDKKYARRANVIRHMEIHFDKKKHQCERCGMFFSQSTVFFNHRLQHEAEDNPLICPICSQSFKTKRTYKRHMITHQDDRPRYGCEICGKVFVDKYTLKMHMQTHHQGDENETPKKKQKPNEEQEQVLFTCVICQDIFLMRDLFNEHMQTMHDVVMDT
ncbi:serendipity locus protein beta [Musca vetustissima]|uniref:serendipity locus protein beta n=1 Tax=Musca vetustissima TaxID=27455 RepID=UPI002AB69881|nr:serendipity locus protein beta [Musca vetustissima]